MKKCANCGFESPDEAASCPSCSTDSFISTSPEALGHIISPEEQQFWERMTCRHFAVFFIRLQALWLFFAAVLDASYLTDYLMPGVRFTPHAKMIVVRAALNVAAGIICLRYADRIISWMVKDILPKRVKTPAA
jgi:RNA polymerase subunit RPABC4/transcription elongation factor Spt4